MGVFLRIKIPAMMHAGEINFPLDRIRIYRKYRDDFMRPDAIGKYPGLRQQKSTGDLEQ